ncbi:uncharacterized protein EDB93DRAFT_1100293 [Suillus bovinus]|uniref:uncharacterized protein n=1 Tax=Suillus bovinus TaxID=48563 RepID=UPI001B87D448|nr:uncharacterized protein EDB93DRAFT_1100293 [Suillus bovinus]KAG2158640.1 hypothetical protein EDB93DRAFT_1100293 [Suillus bovinus]
MSSSADIMESQPHECYLFSNLLPSMMPISGLISLDAGFDFVSYVSISEQKTMLFPLYCLSTSLGTLRHQISLIGYIATPIMHNGMEIVHHSVYKHGSVPIYTQHAEPSGKLDLAPQAYMITDHLLYIKYDWLPWSSTTTITYYISMTVHCFPVTPAEFTVRLADIKKFVSN